MDTPGECWMETSSQRPNKINQGLIHAAIAAAFVI
jgi:hypothetical protein